MHVFKINITPCIYVGFQTNNGTGYSRKVCPHFRTSLALLGSIHSVREKHSWRSFDHMFTLSVVAPPILLTYKWAVRHSGDALLSMFPFYVSVYGKYIYSDA